MIWASGLTVTIDQLWRAAAKRFAAAGIEPSHHEAQLLVRHVLDLDATGMVATGGDPVPSDIIVRFDELLARRLAGEPLARLMGYWEFYGRKFDLNAHTLVPRADTEILVDVALEYLHGKPNPGILDLGTGSGCILLTLLAERTDARGLGVDVREEALAQVAANAELLGVADRVRLQQSDWFTDLAANRFDLIVSNPPYIASGQIADLQNEVQHHDPVRALDGGADGLRDYRTIAQNAGRFLMADGALMVEIGFDQAVRVTEIFRLAGFDRCSVHQDLAGNDRIVTAYQAI